MPMIEIKQTYRFHSQLNLEYVYHINTDKVEYTRSFIDDGVFMLSVGVGKFLLEFSSRDSDTIEYFKDKEQDIIAAINREPLSLR